MVSVKHQLFAILWKSVIQRKNRWVVFLLEVMFPLLAALFSREKLSHHVFNCSNSCTVYQPKDVLKWPIVARIAYTPSGKFTDEIMERFYNKTIYMLEALPTRRKRSVVEFKPLPKESEKDLELWLGTPDKEYVLFKDPSVITESIGIVFVVTNPLSKIFKYKIRTNIPSMNTKNSSLTELKDIYKSSDFQRIQFHLDIQLLQSVGFNISENRIYYGMFPKPLEDMEKSFQAIHFCMTFSYIFLVISLVNSILTENSSGTKESMTIIGVSPILIWTQWFIYAILAHIPTTVICAVFLTILRPHVICLRMQCAVIVWILFALFIVNCIFLNFVISTFFTNPTRCTIVCVVGWFTIHISSMLLFVQQSKYSDFQRIIFCLVPLNNLICALYSITSFYGTWTFEKVFTNGSNGSLISVGASLIIFFLETSVLIFYLVLSEVFAFEGCCLENIFAKLRSSRTDAVVGRRQTIPPKYIEDPAEGAKILISIRGLCKKYRGVKKSVVNMDLDIYKGEIVALLGHDGAGKTTVLSMLLGLQSPTSGLILFEDKDIRSKQSKFTDGLAFCSGHHLKASKITVLQEFLFVGMLKGMSYSKARTHGDTLLRSLHLEHVKHTVFNELPDGLKRQLSIYISLLGNPKVLVLDEPTVGLDILSKRRVWDIILSEREKFRPTIIVSTNSIKEADALGDRIAVMDHGQLMFYGTPKYIKEIFGTGYHIRITTDYRSRQINVSELVESFIKECKINIVSPIHMDIKIDDKYVSNFPTLFEALETHSVELGINDISVSCTTIEDVFLKMYEEPEDDTYCEEYSLTQSVVVNIYGLYVLLHQLKILFWRRFIHKWRRFSFTFVVILLTSIMIIAMCKFTNVFMKKFQDKPIQNPLKIGLDLYPGFEHVVSSDDDKMTEKAADFISSNRGQVVTVKSNYNISLYQKKWESDISKYFRTLTSLQIANNTFTMLYQGFSHVPPIAVNLLSNILLQNFTHSNKAIIEVFNHPHSSNIDYCNVDNSFNIISSIIMIWSINFTFVLSCLMVVFIPFAIEDRVTGFKHQQFLAGVFPFLYHLVNFVFDYSVYICIILIYMVLISIFLEERLTFTVYLLLILVTILLLFGLSAILLIYLFSLTIDRQVLGACVFTITNSMIVLISLCFTAVGDQPMVQFMTVDFVLSLNPLYAAIQSIQAISETLLLHYLCYTCGNDEACELIDLSLLTIPSEDDSGGILLFLLYLVLTGLLYSILLILIEYGIVRKLCLVLKLGFHHNLDSSWYDPQTQDEDVKIEYERVRQIKQLADDRTFLVADGLLKKYYTGKIAVDRVSFTVSSGECFGILGARRSGKTTLIKILTGAMFSDSGDAKIHDYSISQDTNQYRKFVGYCPQSYTIQDTLSGEEILWIIATLRGIPRQLVQSEVARWLKMVVIEYTKKPFGEYSHAERRKLSVAMAFIGDPEVVFLDEPTTGVDPYTRRILWNLIQSRQKVGQAIVLTSHSMEECTTLCTRLTILKEGKMTCIGSPEHLKKKYRRGYTVTFRLAAPSRQELEKLNEEFLLTFPRSVINCKLISLMHYQILETEIVLSKLFSELIRIGFKYGFVDYFTVSTTTLEQLFLSHKVKIQKR